MFSTDQKEAILEPMSKAAKPNDQKPVYLPQYDSNHARKCQQAFLDSLVREMKKTK